MVVVPSVNATVPVGVPAPGVVTVMVAVKVTACPVTEGLADEPTPEVVAALLTVWLNAVDVDPEKFVSPEYTAVML
jgi:hypothetical protein